jgi:hypothetical protein
MSLSYAGFFSGMPLQRHGITGEVARIGRGERFRPNDSGFYTWGLQLAVCAGVDLRGIGSARNPMIVACDLDTDDPCGSQTGEITVWEG